jgi:mono/diheme cytochrome c family protein/glucose/arabinose dehydrogenase
MLLSPLFVLLLAQGGDVKGEKQPPLPEEILKRTPPSTVVPPDKALETFRVAPGFRVELVAAEPLIHDPIAYAFDEDGRLFVIEMRGYMPDLDGKGENAPVGRVVMLEDTDGDGKMDRSTVVVDGLVQPRAIAVARGGLLVAEPPNLWFIKDGRKTLVDGTYCPARCNPEHAANGLLPAIDNWFYNANSTWRYRFVGGQWARSHTRFRGQWGITQDDLGRLFFNYNTIFLRGDLVPCYTSQAHSRMSTSVNLDLTKEQTTWPVRPTPGVNRGYRPGVLRPDGTIVETNSACAPVVHRGDALTPDCRGNIFVCDPSGNLVKRLILDVQPDRIVPRDAYDKAEFLASTDERFRPVFVGGGPDGALYVVDMYRGIIQHGAYMTSFLRAWIQSRGLATPIGLGRIYRVVDASRPRAAVPRFSAASSAELVTELSHPNGWRRDTAQRLLIERGNADVVPTLRQLARAGGDPIPRLHALWTLEGLGAVDPETLASMDHVEILRPATEALRGTAGPLVSPVDGLIAAAERDPAVPDAMLADRELDFLEAIMSSEHWDDEQPGRAALLERASRRIAVSGKGGTLTWLLELTASQAEAARWRQRALLRGLAETPEQRLAARPSALMKLSHSEDAEISGLAAKIRGRLRWPGDEQKEPDPPPLVPLTPDERIRFDRGRRQFLATCAGCHRRSGLGEEGGPPPLVDSSLIQGSDERLVRIVLHGLEGPLRAEGKVYRNLNMPAILNLSSDEVAEILTYVRREWGHRADPVPVEKVRAIRKATEDREEPWTQVELLKLR